MTVTNKGRTNLERMLKHYKYRLEFWHEDKELKPLASESMRELLRELEYTSTPSGNNRWTVAETIDKAIQKVKEIPDDLPEVRQIWTARAYVGYTKHVSVARNLEQEWKPFKCIVQSAAVLFKKDIEAIWKKLELSESDLKTWYTEIDSLLPLPETQKA